MEFLLVMITAFNSCSTDITLLDTYKQKEECMQKAEEFNVQNKQKALKMVCYEAKELKKEK